MSDRRLFVAVDLPDHLTEDVAELQDRFAGIESLSFTEPSQAHITLKFLGDTPSERVEDIVGAIERGVSEAAVDPFEVEVAGLGVFPSTDYIRVVWAGTDVGTVELTRLHEEIERETVVLGFDEAEHEFTPHLTLARMADARGKARVREIVGGLTPTVGRFRVEEVRLKESVLRDDGPEYETVARVGL